MVRAIGRDNDSTLESEKQFTPGRATKMLPLIRRIVADMVAINQSIQRQKEQLEGIDALPSTIEHSNYQEELRDIRSSLADDEARLQECVSELASLGVTPHLPIDGSVDFPATLNRRAVSLCWHPDDDAVRFWHEVGGEGSDASQIRQRVEGQKFGDSLN